jgi:NADPH:quinone reductase
MRAVVMTAVGGPEVLELVELPEPKLEGDHDVLVHLRAAGVNPVDYKLRSRGTIGGSLPAVLGWDGSGVVESTGPAVSRVRAGDEVYFCDGGFGPTPGTYEELKVVHEDYLAKKPNSLSFVEAAAAPLVTITAWEALNERARVTRDQFVLVQAGAGGVGHMSVQIACLAGARVAATVTPGPKTELASSLGAQLCIDYRNEDVAAKVRDWTGMDGADVVHDTVGGRTFTACFSLVRPYGDLVTNVESPWEPEALKAMHDRNLRVSFTWMPSPSVFGWPEHKKRQRVILEEAAAHFDAGRLRAQVGATFSLEQAAEAQRELEAGHIMGKAVLTIS